MRELCEAEGIVYSHLPDRAGVGQTHFWAVTKLTSSPSLEWMCAIAKALNVDVVELLETDAPSKKPR